MWTLNGNIGCKMYGGFFCVLNNLIQCESQIWQLKSSILMSYKSRISSLPQVFWLRQAAQRWLSYTEPEYWEGKLAMARCWCLLVMKNSILETQNTEKDQESADVTSKQWVLTGDWSLLVVAVDRAGPKDVQPVWGWGGGGDHRWPGTQDLGPPWVLLLIV